MSTSGKTWRRVCLGMVGAALTLQGATAGEAADREAPSMKAETPPAYIRVGDPQTARVLRQAIDGAHEWLGNPGCQRVFSDFKDLSGKAIADVLTERGETGQEHLARVFFYDGSQQKPCTGPGSAAVTMPGSHIVFVCPASFQKLSREPGKARVVVIHELLHTLGLGENPPSSREITARVHERCWE